MIKGKLLICGGGIIGVTIAREAAYSKKFSEITVLEKDNKLGTHATTRNSGVVHSGFYYSPESEKAKFCIKGNKLLREYCIKNKIRHNRCGKVVVTKNSSEEKILWELYNRGQINGCEIQLLNKKYLKDYEPLASTYENFIWSPNTWSISPIELFNCLITECKELGIKFIKDEKIVSANNKYIITAKKNRFNFDYFINACGGYALEVAKLFGVDTKYKLLPFKGLYLKSTKKISKFNKHIYPVPDINQPFLGIHTTKTHDDYLKLGPTAIPVLSPENYNIFKGLNLKMSADILLLQINLFGQNQFGFRDLAFKEIKYFIKENIIKKANQLTNVDLKNIKFEWNSPGIRAQLYDKENQILENDFILINKNNTYHILNSISPAWTCSLRTAKSVLEKLIKE